VSLSSSEAEYYSLSEAAKEIKFIVQTLITMGLKVTLPVVVRVDNIGAIFMAENISATSRSKHADLRFHFVKQYVDEDFISIVFVKSADNKSDILTKNTSRDVHERHACALVGKAEWTRNRNKFTTLKFQGIGTREKAHSTQVPRKGVKYRNPE
jgi:hypothetical protein